MKNLAKLGGCVVLMALASSCATTGTGGGGTVQVNYQNPERFTDVRRTYTALHEGVDEGYLRDLKDYIERTGRGRIPAGYTLTLTITDIDMAGDFEPERGASLNHVRIMRSVYPPRIDLSYRLTDASGAVQSEGQEQLRNQAFDWTVSPIQQNDPLRYEKDLLNDFLSQIGGSVGRTAAAGR